MAEKVVSYFGSSFAGMSLVYEIEAVPLGTGGALEERWRTPVRTIMFVFNGDT